VLLTQPDLWTAVGEEFGAAVSPPVPFEDATPQACAEVVVAMLGAEAGASRLGRLTGDDLERLAAAFAAFFEVAPPDVEALRRAGLAVARRWPD
jgi:hypothetical protein